MIQFFNNIDSLNDRVKGAVIVIGNFDGVHLGHQALINQARSIADDLKTAVGVLTFEPHPHRLFRPDEPPSRITPLELKRQKLVDFGADFVFSLPFNWDFASQSADQFIQNILKDGLGAVHVVVGYDFKFGQLRQGTAQTIEAAGISVTSVSEITKDGLSELSSSRVRQYLRHGKIEEANRILGWDWEIHGEVVKGDQRGRELGYPTANMKLGDTIHPAYGIYACAVRIEGREGWHMAASNIGIRPMFEVPIAQVETFIFDFDEEIYGQTLCVKPIERLRGEAKFNSLDALIDQMQKDCDQARDILSKRVEFL